MNPNNENKPNPQDQAALAATLSEEHTLTFTKGELLAMFNILTNVQVKYGDFIVIDPIIKKLHPIVTVDSNIPQAPQADDIIGAKKATD